MSRHLLAAAAVAAGLGTLALGVAVLASGGGGPAAQAAPPPVLIAASEPDPRPAAPAVPAPRPVEAVASLAPQPAPVEALPRPAPVPPAILPPAAPPAAKPARPRPPVVDHRYDGVLTVAEIGRIRAALRLSPDQEPYWPSISSVLREVGRRQMAEVDAGQQPSFDLPGDLSSRLYTAVTPLLGTLRDDQKEEIRRRARMLGLESVASFI